MHFKIMRFLQLFVLLFLISCNKKQDKEYSCTCNIHGSNPKTVTKTVMAKSLSNAQSDCNDYGTSEAGTAHFECNVQ